jgi:adenylate cyclase
MSLRELAAATGEELETLGRWQVLGLLSQELDRPVAAERVRLIRSLLARGASEEAIAAACESQGEVLSRLVLQSPTEHVGPRSIAEAADEVALDRYFLHRLLVASGLSDQTELFEEDVAMLRAAAAALSGGLPEDALLQLVRVYNDSLSRVADAESRLFHFYVHERLRADGLTGVELADAADAISTPLRKLNEPAILYFHAKAFQRAVRDDFLGHLVDAGSPLSDVLGQVPVTILFIDLAGFTVMTEIWGDRTAVAVVERLSDIVREAAAARSGRVLKQIGDEFMLAFSEPDAAVTVGLAVMAGVAALGRFPEVRLGANTGTALYREGDYLGAMVNLAARIADAAGPGQFLVSDALRAALEPMEGIRFDPLGPRALKNVASPVELYAVSSDHEDAPAV